MGNVTANKHLSFVHLKYVSKKCILLSLNSTLYVRCSLYISILKMYLQSNRQFYIQKLTYKTHNTNLRLEKKEDAF